MIVPASLTGDTNMPEIARSSPPAGENAPFVTDGAGETVMGAAPVAREAHEYVIADCESHVHFVLGADMCHPIAFEIEQFRCSYV